MRHRYSIETLNRVSQIHTAKDIRQLSHAQFPGTHCPLFGVALTAGYVKDMTILLVGTDECTYYTKTFNMERRASDRDMQDNFLSFAINQDDVVFGCASKVEEAILHIDRTCAPQAIMVVTTCVLEVIGEDFEALVDSIQEQVNAKLLVVRTEHFKCNSHIPGIERTLTALSSLMAPQPVKPGTVNILGHRYAGVNDTELLKILTSKGVTVNLVIPSSCSVQEIAAAPSASLNIVSDFSALPLAEAMKKQFGVPYVYFDKYLSQERISTAYHELANALKVDLTLEVTRVKQELKQLLAEKSSLLKGKRFIYGNTPMLAFEFTSFLCSIGMEPLLIQARDLYVNDDLYMQEILASGWDPHVSRIANIAPLQTLYPELRPDIYIGHENPQRLMELGITQMAMDSAAAKLGFEVPMTVVQNMVRSLEASQSMQRRTHHAAL